MGFPVRRSTHPPRTPDDLPTCPRDYYRHAMKSVYAIHGCVVVSLISRTSAFLHPRHRHAKSQSKISATSEASADASLPRVLCVGETLYDSLPTGLFLGGAPTNVAAHLASILSSPETVGIAACVGDDQLGRDARRRLELKGVNTDFLQCHESLETGMATAVIDGDGDATYEFITPAAWDGLKLDERVSNSFGEDFGDTIFIMGTIAGRLGSEQGATSASTMAQIRNSAANVVFDVNLRPPWYRSAEVLEFARGNDASEELALVKLNEDELSILEEWCGLHRGGSSEELTGSALEKRMLRLVEPLRSKRICVTRGGDGAALLCLNRDGSHAFCEHGGYELSPRGGDSDTVGAGDSFLAALVNSLLIRLESPERALQRACALGAYVASCRGATPEHSDAPDHLKSIFI